jgi:hypothetical protein
MSLLIAWILLTPIASIIVTGMFGGFIGVKPSKDGETIMFIWVVMIFSWWGLYFLIK